MREIRSSGSEGGVADNGHPYPYPSALHAELAGLGRPLETHRNGLLVKFLKPPNYRISFFIHKLDVKSYNRELDGSEIPKTLV
jgi:hypothetical protein